MKNTTLNVTTISVGPFEVNCYLLAVRSSDALVVDPGAEPERILATLQELSYRPEAYLVTHGHVDHLSALADLMAKYPAPVYMHEADQAWAFTPDNEIPGYYSAPKKPAGHFRAVREGEVLQVAGISVHILETPGHTPGGICLWLPEHGALFSGDTLFYGSVGRTDLPGGSAKTLALSLRKLAQLPDEVTVYPGHGPPTHIGLEKRQNVFLRSSLSGA